MKWMKSVVNLVLFFLYLPSPSGQIIQQQPRHIQVYQRAEKLYYNEQPSDASDKLALQSYLEVIKLHPGSADSVLWDSYYKAGIFLQTSEQFAEAIPYFQKALELANHLPVIRESSLYLPNLYLGNSYYSVSYLDSAAYYYKKAEEIASKYTGLEGIERLYNTIGALHYESGDFIQSKIYFEKALDVITDKQPGNLALIVNYKNNLAATLRQLKEYDRAMSIFKELYRYNISRDPIAHNIAAIYIDEEQNALAISWLKKINKSDIKLFNDLALAYRQDNQPDSSEFYLRKAFLLNTNMYGSRKNVQRAVSYKYLADLALSRYHIDSAIKAYQEAVIQLVYDFNETDTRKNPVEYYGQFSVSELFETLVAKARAFRIRYVKSHDINDLRSCLDTYQSVYKLTDYVIRNYGADESRLFFNDQKHLSHNEPINVSIELHRITGEETYLEQAFLFDEKNKAAVLSLHVQQKKLKQSTGIPVDLLYKEKQLRRNINRLQMEIEQAADSIQLDRINGNIRDHQISLAQLQKEFDKFPEYRKKRFTDETASVSQVKKIIPDDAAILSYHMGDTNLLAFLITSKHLKYVTLPVGTSFPQQIREFYQNIQYFNINNTEYIDKTSRQFYQLLIEPFEDEISRVKHLMVIPDDELSLLPFQLLKKRNGEILLRSHTISFNYSCTILEQFKSSDKKVLNKVLAFAPFAVDPQLLRNSGFEALPASKLEIQFVNGEKLVGESADKQTFIKRVTSFPVVHLATHAAANDRNPMFSYISFYPVDSAEYSYKLFTSEIMDLSLEPVKLVILSACETGTGELVKGEGLMSMTRAFSYAGCQNVIASLWKADDKSTAMISSQLHQYLGNDESPAEALRHATLDYINNDDVPLRQKTPAYWAHLRLIGVFENEGTHHYWILITIVCVLISAIVIFYFSRKVLSVSKGSTR